MNFAIQGRALSKVYSSGAGEFQALKSVDFAVSPGEFVMVSGPSGSGKTTLLSILGCVLRPTAGTLELLGEDVAHAPEAELPRLRREYIGFVFQFHNLIGALSAAENVELMLHLRGFDPRRTREESQRLLDAVGLAKKAQNRPRDLSGGQRQRVAIARALAGSPPIVLADEPTATLDAVNGLAVTELLRRLAKVNGHTVVVVTHDNRIFHLADRIVYMEDGAIVGQSKAEQTL